ANPLNDGSNTIGSLDKGVPNKTVASTWNGTGFNGASKSTGTWSVNLPIGHGVGFFLKIPSSPFTNTFFGTAPLTSSVALGGGENVLGGSVIPFTGNLNDSGPTTLNLNPSLPTKTTLSVWNGTGSTGVSKASGSFANNPPIGL